MFSEILRFIINFSSNITRLSIGFILGVLENGKQFDKIRNKPYISQLDDYSLSSDDEFDAEVGAIIYGPRLVRSYYKFCEQ